MDKFREHIAKNLEKCEVALKSCGAYDQVPEDVNLYPGEGRLSGPDGSKRWQMACDIVNCYTTLSIGYKYLGEDEKAKKMFDVLSGIRIPTLKVAAIDDRVDLAWQYRDGLAAKQIEKGAQIDLAKRDPGLAAKLFTLAAENQAQNAEIIEHDKFLKLHDIIAARYLWRAYALTIMGKYDEAIRDLTEAGQYFTLHKEHGGVFRFKMEHHLKDALVALCEYELHPGDDNRKKARIEHERYIKRISNVFEKQMGYLYYYHLMEKFPDIFG